MRLLLIEIIYFDADFLTFRKYPAHDLAAQTLIGYDKVSATQSNIIIKM